MTGFLFLHQQSLQNCISVLSTQHFQIQKSQIKHLLSMSTNISVSLCEINIHVPYQVSFRGPG